MSDTDSRDESISDVDWDSLSDFASVPSDHSSTDGSDDNDRSFSDDPDDSDGLSYLSNDSDVEPDDLGEETDFADPLDAAAFRGLSKHHYRGLIRPLKSGHAPFFNYNFHSQLSDDGKKRLGKLLANANESQAITEVAKQLNMKFDENRPQSVGLVLRGPFRRDHALRRFKITGAYGIANVTLPLGDWRCISQYLAKAPKLRHLDLHDLSLGGEELELLASALERAKLRTLAFSGLNTREDDGSLGLFFASINASKLETIDLVGCGAGHSTCQGLANILRMDKSPKLEALNLNDNSIDDGCVRLLCDSLVENTSLKFLHLRNNENITDEGWEVCEKLVFDTSSLESLYDSNHTLLNIPGHPSWRSMEGKITHRGCTIAGHRKIIRFLTKDTQCYFNMAPLVGYGVEMMPLILEFFWKHLETDDDADESSCPLFCTYEILRRWDVSEFFGFPSAERVRLSARMKELETRNDELLREVELLREENRRLKSDARMFTSKTKVFDEGSRKSKRARS